LLNFSFFKHFKDYFKISETDEYAPTFTFRMLRTVVEPFLPDKMEEAGVSGGEEEEEKLEILQYLDRLEEATEAYFNRWASMVTGVSGGKEQL